MKIAANPRARAAFAPFLRVAPSPVLMTYGMDVFVEVVLVKVVFVEVVVVEVILGHAALVEVLSVEVVLVEVMLGRVTLVKVATKDIVLNNEDVDECVDLDEEDDDTDEEEVLVSVFPPQNFGLIEPQISEP